MSTLSIVVASIITTQAVLIVIYDLIALCNGWHTISSAIYEWDKSCAQLPRWILAGLWMHVFHGEAVYGAVRRYFRRMP